MSSLDKDIFQKQISIRYCISNGLVPFLEVLVGNSREVSDSKTAITDIDVLGLEVSRRGLIRRTVFDCKTVSKMSPINRAFWAKGLMDFAGCDEAYVILKKRASEAHRLSAKKINVHIFADEDFEQYAASASLDFLEKNIYSMDMAAWNRFFLIPSKYPGLVSLVEYVWHRVPLESDGARLVREIVSLLRATRGEFDPEKNEHLSLFLAVVLSFMLAMSRVSVELSDMKSPEAKLAEYEQILKYYMWGGREGYFQRRELRNAVMVAKGREVGELELPGWSEFIQLSLSFLDAPADVRLSLVAIREISLRLLSEEKTELKDQVLGKRFQKSNRIRPFIFSSISYLVKACGLPKDLEKAAVSLVSEL